MMVWLQFIACTVIIVFAGAKLSKYGDVIAEKTGLGRTWIGVVLIATVTSLPELITGISSVTVNDLPDIAAGDVLGSCMFNLAIIAVLDFGSGEKPITTRADQGPIVPAAFGILLLAVVVAAMGMRDRLPTIGWFGIFSVLAVLIYVAAMRMIFHNERKRQESATEMQASKHEMISKKRAFTMYAINAVVVIAAATWLPRLGAQIAAMTGLGHTFVGSLFIGLSTSLPELVVTVAAVKAGAPNIALGNLFGSNLLNVAILGVDDLLYTKGPLLSQVTGTHILTASAAIAMTAVSIIGMTYHAPKHYYRLRWDTWIILFTFGTASVLLYWLK